MAGYLALPSEIKDLIVLLPCDLSRLSRTSKAMRRALLPRLYRSISLRWEAFKPPPRISSLCKALAQVPSLAEAVEELYFYGENYLTRVESVKEEHIPYQRKITSYLVDAKPKASTEDNRLEPMLQIAKRNIRLSQAEWMLVLDGQNTPDVMIAAIITLCPNLRVLHLDSGFLNQNTVLPMIIHYHLLNIDHVCSTPALMKLKKVHLGQDLLIWNSTRLELFKFPIAACLPYFYLPSLESFSAPLPNITEVSGDSAHPSLWPTATLPVCSVRTLDLHTSRATAATLGVILAQTPHLQSLHYEYWPWLEARTTERLNCIGVRRALEPLSDTLTDLTITLKPFSTEADEVEEAGVWAEGGRGLGSLTFLSRLAKLEIALPVLLGWNGDTGLSLNDGLPSSLRDMCIRDDCVSHAGNVFDEERTVEELRYWIGNKAWRKSTPNLRSFGLRLCASIGDDWGMKSRNLIMDMCEQEGLEFWFIKSDPDQEYDEDKDVWYDADNPLQYPFVARA
ncbi:hypothetical protein OPT61_g236 [Boeremia exigua]|uniref:Uncharacterized protein n=1 Tax=Boeremia exigua TaxID=749465 RepID=A0ACC2IUH0_9PLEO|nr:hypothetical protein OPT61_g236 [Boeremia exigua]